MEDLLRSQIHDNCKLALPEGLKDLMNDISREVLRAQPKDLNGFIANYLGALLEARKTLSIACEVCSDICKCTCDHIKPELYNELKKIGLNEDDLEIAVEVIERHLKGNNNAKDTVTEQSLLLKLLRKTNINEEQLPKIQQAVQKAYKQQYLAQKDVMTKKIFICPDFTPSESFVPLSKNRPYSAHDSVSISEREHLSFDYTKRETTVKIESRKIEICNEATAFIENNKKYKSLIYFDDDKQLTAYTKAMTSTDLNLNGVEMCDENEITMEETSEQSKEMDKHSISHDHNGYEMSASNGQGNKSEQMSRNGHSYHLGILASLYYDIQETPMNDQVDNIEEMPINYLAINSEEIYDQGAITEDIPTDVHGQYSGDEVQEFIENDESEYESGSSSIIEMLQIDV